MPITLFSWARRGRGDDRVHHQPGVHDGVDLGRLDHPPQQRVLGADLDVLGALQLDAGLLVVHAHDRLDRGVGLQRAAPAAAPVGGQAGDQDPLRVHPNHTDLRLDSMSNRFSWIRARTSWATVWTSRAVVLLTRRVEVDRLQEAQLELGRQVAQHAQRAEVRERGRQRHVQQPGELLQQVELGEHRRRLLGAHHAHGHDRHPRLHGRLHEAAATEAAQPVAVLVELLGALAALGEHQHELLLVVEQPLHVGRVGGHGSHLREQHREARVALEEVLDRDVQRPRVRVLLADGLADHRRVRAAARRSGWTPAAPRPTRARSRCPRPRPGTSSGRGSRPASGPSPARPARSGPSRSGCARARHRAGGAAGRPRGGRAGRTGPPRSSAGRSRRLSGVRARSASGAIMSGTGSRRRSSSGQSGAPMTPSSSPSTSSSFHGWTSVAASMPRSRAPAMFTGLSSTSTSISSSTQRVSLSKLQCRSS